MYHVVYDKLNFRPSCDTCLAKNNLSFLLKKLLAEFGERLRLARLRRNISAETLASRSSISRMRLHRAEKRSPAVSMSTYLRILAALHLADDIALLARDDKLGRKLQDIQPPKNTVHDGQS